MRFLLSLRHSACDNRHRCAIRPFAQQNAEQRGQRPVLDLSRHAAQRLRCASAIRARPSGVFGPVLLPPWNRHRRLPGSTRILQTSPLRVLAPQRGRIRFGKGCRPDPSAPMPASGRMGRRRGILILRRPRYVCAGALSPSSPLLERIHMGPHIYMAWEAVGVRSSSPEDG